MRKEILRLENVSQQLDGEYYLKDINFYILEGEVMGVITSEVKGKQELIEILEKNIPITYGKVYLNNRMVNSYAHSSLQDNKVYEIGQRSTLVSDLTVYDNLFVLRKGFRKNILNKRVLRNQTERIMQEFGLTINPDTVAMYLKPIDRCLVELLRAYLIGCSLVILNNCNNFLGNEDSLLLQDMMEELCRRNIAFLYMGNHHEDVFKMSHRAILFSNGQIQKVFYRKEMDDGHIDPYILKFRNSSNKSPEEPEEEILKMEGLEYNNLKGLNLSVRKGECVTILDNDNNVIDDILGVMARGEKPLGGNIWLKKKIYTPKMSRNFLLNGVGVIEDDPVHSMIFPEISVIDNLAFLLDRKINRTVVKRRYYESIEKEYYPLMGEGIKERDVQNLQYEDLYKLVYYRMHLYHPDVVFCISPFAHGDMNCRQVICRLIHQLKEIGISVVLLQINISDAMAVADRLFVVHQGKVTRKYKKEEFYLIER